MRTVKVTRNYTAYIDGIVPLLTGSAMEKIITEQANIITERARSLAPVKSGAYWDSIRVVIDHHPSRVTAHVGAHVDYGNVVESRSHVLRRALG